MGLISRVSSRTYRFQIKYFIYMNMPSFVGKNAPETRAPSCTLSRKEKNRITAAKNRAKAKAEERLLDTKILNEIDKSKQLDGLIEQIKSQIEKSKKAIEEKK